MRIIIYGALSCLFYQSTLCAQEVNASDGFFEDTPIILTASRMIKPKQESPASVTVIDRAMIEGSGIRDLAELFRLVPGFVVGYQNGHQPVVTYHGLAWTWSREMQVQIDGRSVFIPSFGGTPWTNLPVQIEDIERIEVIRGPNSVTHGANAFLATINIITRSAAEDKGIAYAVATNAPHSMTVNDVYFRAGNHIGDLDWRLSLGSKQDDGSGGSNDDKRKDIINLRLDYAPDSSQRWMLQLGQNNATQQRGEEREDLSDTDIIRDETATNQFINIQWENRWSESSSTLVKLFSSSHDVTDNYFLNQVEFGPLNGSVLVDFDRLSERTDLEIIQNQDIGDAIRLVYGGSMRQESVKSLYLFNTEDSLSVDTQRLFGSVEWRPNEDWLLDFGLLAEDSSLTDPNTSPRISVIRKLTSEHALRWVSSQAYRNPILWETEGRTEFSLLNPSPSGPGVVAAIIPFLAPGGELRPERIVSNEIGLRSQLEATSLETDVKLFAYRITDPIYTSDATDGAELDGNIIFVDSNGNSVAPGPIPTEVATHLNLEDINVEGIELEFRQKEINRMSYHGGLSILRARSANEKFVESFPKSTWFFSAGYGFDDRNTVNLSVYHVNALSWLDDSDNLPANNRIDFRYQHQFLNGVQLEFIGQNIQGEVEDYAFDQTREPTAFLKLSGEF